MAAITICSDFGAQKNSQSLVSTVPPAILQIYIQDYSLIQSLGVEIHKRKIRDGDKVR